MFSFSFSFFSFVDLPLVSGGRHVPDRAGGSLVEPGSLLDEDLAQVWRRIHDAEDHVDVRRVETLTQKRRSEEAALSPTRNNFAGMVFVIGVLQWKCQHLRFLQNFI